MRRVVAAVVCAGLVAFGGLPVATGPASAAPVAKRCDQMFKVTGSPAKPGSLPWENGTGVRPESDWDTYDFENQRQALDGMTLPADPAEQKEALRKVGTDYKKYPEGSKERVYATYNNNQTFGKQKWTGTFEEWLSESYIENYSRNRRGAAFEAKVVRDLKLLGPDWLCQESIEVTDENGKKVTRKYDAVNHKTREFVEFKSGGAHNNSQVPVDRAVLKDPKYQGYKLRYVLGQEQEADTRKMVEKLNRDVGGSKRVTTYEHRSTATVKYTPGPYSKYDTTLNPGTAAGQGARGGANDMIRQSPANPETMRRQIERARGLDPLGQRVRGPGGVDFTTLELRFVGKPVKGQGLDYSFSAKKMPDPAAEPGFGGQEKAALVSDSFFTWLALTPDKFWVNLNPDEPARVMDDAFGRTDAGRVLLEADLEMKHDYAKALDPKTAAGKKLWERMIRVNGQPCLQGTRNWIVPEPAQVREQDGGVYILNTPLKVNSVAQETSTPGPGGGQACRLTAAQIKHNQQLIDSLIIPEVAKKINNDAAYADLRRVYTSRVAAEWIRRQDAARATDYRSIINSGDVSKWPIRGAKWDKNDTWKKYYKSYTQGDYSFEWTEGQQVYVFTVGGVDFSQAPKKDVAKPQFTAEHHYLPRTTKTSVQAMTDDAETGDLLFLGGNTKVKAVAAQPPTTGGGGDGDGGEGGGLPITGSRIPMGLLLAFAVALIVGGGGLLWWTRHRRRFEI